MNRRRHSREVEIKLRVGNLKRIVSALKTLGAREMGRVYERDTLFDTADEFFRKREAILRLRREESAPSPGRRSAHRRQRGETREGLLTFKGLVDGGRSAARTRYKEREEIEFRIRDVERFARVLGRIGMRPWFRYEKYRTTHRSEHYPGLKFELDETPIGSFLELEGPRREIDRAAKALGYSPANYITASYLELYGAQRERTGSKSGNMLFAKKKNR